LRGYDTIHCGNHNLNLVILDALPIIEGLRTKLKTIVAHFHRSGNDFRELTKLQKDNSKLEGFQEFAYALINEVTTRWGSTFYMFQRISLLSDCLNEINEKKKP